MNLLLRRTSEKLVADKKKLAEREYACKMRQSLFKKCFIFVLMQKEL